MNLPYDECEENSRFEFWCSVFFYGLGLALITCRGMDCIYCMALILLNKVFF